MEDAGDPNVDLSCKANNIWLVKVPKYLGEKWLEPENRNKPLGTLVASVKADGKKEMSFELNHDLTKDAKMMKNGKQVPISDFLKNPINKVQKIQFF